MTTTMVWRGPAADARRFLSALLLIAAVLLSSLLPALAPLPQAATALTPEQAIRVVGSAVGLNDAAAASRLGRYLADYSTAGLRFQPRFGGPAWEWQLRAVSAGTSALPAVALTGVQPASAAGVVSYDRGAIVERYLERDATTIEQQFVIPAPLALRGNDLVIAGAVRSPGEFAVTASGWAWSSNKGGVNLGTVTVFDASGATLPARMEATATSTRIVVDADALATASYPVTIDPLVGANDFSITDVVGLNGNNGDALEPAAAYNPVTNQYLVVFSADGQVAPGVGRPDGEFEIYGQFVSAADGSLAGAPFRISNTNNFVNNRDTETDPSDDTFGTELATADIFDAFSPDVAYSTRDNLFLVTWVADNTNPKVSVATGGGGTNSDASFETYVQVVSAEGNLRIQWRNETTNDPVGPKDDRISGIQAAKFENQTQAPQSVPDWDAFNPSIAYNSDNGEFMVCWSDDRGAFDPNDPAVLQATRNGGEFEIRCVRFDMNPTEGRPFIGTVPPVLTVSSTGPTRVQDPINYDEYDAYTPDVVYAPFQENNEDTAELFDDEFGQWLVVYAADKATTITETSPGVFAQQERFDIYAQGIMTDGREAWQATQPELTSAQRCNPATQDCTAYGSPNTCAPNCVSYSHPYRNDHRYTTVSTAAGCGDGCDAFAPAVAYNPDRDHFLTVFTADTTNGQEEVHYSLRARTGSTPTVGVQLTKVSNTASGTNDGLEPDVAYDRGLKQWFVAWRGHDASNGALFRIYGQRLNAATPSDADLTPSTKTVPISPIEGLLTLSTQSVAMQPSNTVSAQLGQSIYQPGTPGNDSPEIPTRHDLAPKIAPTGSGDYLIVWSGDITNGTSNRFEVRARQASFNSAPVVTVPADIEDPTPDSPQGSVVTFAAPTATDAEDAVDPTPVCVSSPTENLSSGSTFPVGLTTITCTATDSLGKIGTASFTISVGNDTTAPTLTVPSNITVEATTSAGAPVEFNPLPSATDDLDPEPVVECKRTDTNAVVSSGAIFPLGTTTVSCTATDDFGNVDTETFTVTVTDTTAPTIITPGNVSAPATDAGGAIVTFAAPTASDQADESVTVTCVSTPTTGLTSGSKFPVGVTTITCNASDDAGNAAEAASFTVTVGAFNAQANLGLSRTITPNPVQAGQDLTASFTVSNAGPNNASGVLLMVPVPIGLSFKSAPADCVQQGDEVQCTIGALTNGASQTRAIVFSVNDDTIGDVIITASINGAEGDPTPTNNSVTNTVTVVAVVRLANLGLTRTLTPNPVKAGRDLTASFTVNNAGPDSASNVVLIVPVPNGMSFTSAPVGCALEGGQVRCAIGTLNNGASQVRAIVFSVNSTTVGTINVTGSVSATEGDPATTNNSAGGTVTVQFQLYLPLLRK